MKEAISLKATLCQLPPAPPSLPLQVVPVRGGRWVAVALVGDRHPGLDVADSGVRRNRGGGDGEREGQEPGAV